jgi:hypothetical protein
MEPRTKKQRNRKKAVSPASKPKRLRSPSRRTRTAAAAKKIVDRRQVLAFGMAAAAVAVVPMPAIAARPVTDASRKEFIAEAKRAIALVDEWRRLGEELNEVDAALKTMSRDDDRRSHYLRRVNDLPVERFRAALIADQALRDTLRMTTTERKAAAIKDTLILCMREMTGKEPPVLRRELGLPT